MGEIRTTKIDSQEFVPYMDYLSVKEEKQELEYLWDINEELKEENKKLKEKNKKLKEERDEAEKESQQYKDKQQIFLMTWLRY